MQETVIKELQEKFEECYETDPYGLPGVLKRLFAPKNERFIFIIDEWDCTFRMAKENQEVQKEYPDFQRGLFKGADYVELASVPSTLHNV